MYTLRSLGSVLVLLSLCALLDLAQAQNETFVDCTAPAPSSGFTCNNQTGMWQIGELTVHFGEEITFATDSFINGDLVLQPGSKVHFKDENVLFVAGCASVAGTITLDFGKKSDDPLFARLLADKPKHMTLISGSECFQVTSTSFRITYTGGCTSVHGSLNLIDSEDEDYPQKLIVSNLSKSGTGNCHWLWSSLSALAAIATLIIVPLIEKFVWKLYD